MATATQSLSVDQVGETAGLVWQVLSDHGPLSLTKLVKLIDAPRDMVLLGIGWLAREGKIEITNGRRGRMIALCDEP